MNQYADEVQTEPYRVYRAQITEIEDFAQQSQFCYRITQAYMQEGAAENAAADDPLVRTRAALFRNCLLLEWMYFEQFVKDTLRTLFRKFPARLVALSRNSSVSYEEIGAASLEFSSIERLQELIISRELERQQIGEYPIIGLLGALKRDFKIYNDPFLVEYVYKGQTRNVSRQDLIWLQDIALSTLQHAGMVPPAVQERHPRLSIRDGRLAITEEDYQLGKTILNAIAFAIAQSIENGWYDPK